MFMSMLKIIWKIINYIFIKKLVNKIVGFQFFNYDSWVKFYVNLGNNLAYLLRY
jgi:hypothetical protein